mmetsp:Transcript_26898/g.72525  ORF Transcript_26898/g.72525 Transcript_26898/m.72525 type:complete len:245 (-) Transcript_26898:556-1290(-)
MPQTWLVSEVHAAWRGDILGRGPRLGSPASHHLACARGCGAGPAQRDCRCCFCLRSGRHPRHLQDSLRVACCAWGDKTNGPEDHARTHRLGEEHQRHHAERDDGERLHRKGGHQETRHPVEHLARHYEPEHGHHPHGRLRPGHEGVLRLLGTQVLRAGLKDEVLQQAHPSRLVHQHDGRVAPVRGRLREQVEHLGGRVLGGLALGIDVVAALPHARQVVLVKLEEAFKLATHLLLHVQRLAARR